MILQVGISQRLKTESGTQVMSVPHVDGMPSMPKMYAQYTICSWSNWLMYIKSGTEIPEVFGNMVFRFLGWRNIMRFFPRSMMIYGISYISHLLSIIWDTRISSPMDASKYLRIVSSVLDGFTSIILCGEKGLAQVHTFWEARKNRITIYILSSSKGSMQHGNLTYYLRLINCWPCDAEAKEPDVIS